MGWQSSDERRSEGKKKGRRGLGPGGRENRWRQFANSFFEIKIKIRAMIPVKK